jgi:hypothetical protein
MTFLLLDELELGENADDICVLLLDPCLEWISYTELIDP